LIIRELKRTEKRILRRVEASGHEDIGMIDRHTIPELKAKLQAEKK
jgi:hypothetical protein